MKTRVQGTTVILLILLANVFVLAVPPASAQGAKVLFTLSHGEGDKLLASLEGNLTNAGYTTARATKALDAATLSGVTVLVLGQMYGGAAQSITDAEITAIKDWFNTGGKGIWVAPDSDFGGTQYRIDACNKVLAAIGSKLRAEPTAVQDPVENALSAYRVVATVPNTETAVAEITSGVQKALFHGPTILYGVRDSTNVALETTTLENVYWVMKTSTNGVIVDSDPTVQGPIAHQNAQTGSFVVMAVEKFAGAAGNGKIIATGEAPYGGYQPIYSSSYYGVALQGPTLVLNAIKWAAKTEGFMERYGMLLAGGVAAIVVVVAAVVVVMRRKR